MTVSGKGLVKVWSASIAGLRPTYSFSTSEVDLLLPPEVHTASGGCCLLGYAYGFHLHAICYIW